MRIKKFLILESYSILFLTLRSEEHTSEPRHVALSSMPSSAFKNKWNKAKSLTATNKQWTCKIQTTKDQIAARMK